MSQPEEVVIGIDVGGKRKGFHAVALRDGKFFEQITSCCPTEIADWCFSINPAVIAIDAPCKWSLNGSSRLAERDINIGGEIIQCFKTPTCERASNNQSGFFGWVLNGHDLYEALSSHYPLFDEKVNETKRTCIETFPHAVVCTLAGRVVSARLKAKTRREALRNAGYDDSELPNIDFVDAALCAITAKAFLDDKYSCFGDPEEGFIVVPSI